MAINNGYMAVSEGKSKRGANGRGFDHIDRCPKSINDEDLEARKPFVSKVEVILAAKGDV